MTHLKTILSSALLCGALGAAPAAAMPVNNLAAAAPSNVENVRLVCGPYRCWYRPSYYVGPRYYGRRFYGGWGGRWVSLR
jgi:hypothetical protein